MYAEMRRRLIALILLTAATFVPVSNSSDASDSDFDSKSGYRIARYRSPVPSDVPGGTVISAADVADLIKTRDPVLLDVMAADGAGPDPESGEWRITTPRKDIPGSVWLPDVGKGVLTGDMDAYFKDNLFRLTGGNKARAVIVYCQADCWMSWNAVRRASSYGYTALFWFPEGSDGWRDWDGTFTDAKPVPLRPGLGNGKP